MLISSPQRHMAEQSRKGFISPVGLQDILVLIALHSLVALRLANFADDPSTGRHLSTGNWILSHHAVPKLDPFLAAADPRPWVSQQWLGDTVLWLLYSAGAWPLVYAFLIVVFAFTYFGILYRAASRQSGQYLLASLALLLSFEIGKVHFILTPVIFGIFFFALLYVALARVYKELSANRDPPLLRRLFYILPLLFIVWANVHSSFPLGLLLLSLLLVGLVLDARTMTLVPPTAVGSIFKLLILCAAVTVLNPHGVNIYREAFAQVSSVWPALSFHAGPGYAFEISICILILGLYLQPALRPQVGWFWVLSILVFAHLALTAARFAPFYGIVAIIPVIFALHGIAKSDFFARPPGMDRLRKAAAALEHRESTSMQGYAVLSVLLALLLVDCTANHKLLLYEGPFGPDGDSYPYAALDVARETSITSGAVIVAAPPKWGGFITFYGEGELQPIIDDRVTLVGREFLEEYVQALRPGREWMEYLMKVGANRLLLPRLDPLAVAIRESGDALPLYEDKNSILFELPSAR